VLAEQQRTQQQQLLHPGVCCKDYTSSLVLGRMHNEGFFSLISRKRSLQWCVDVGAAAV
jgi:hypothetical protein